MKEVDRKWIKQKDDIANGNRPVYIRGYGRNKNDGRFRIYSVKSDN